MENDGRCVYSSLSALVGDLVLRLAEPSERVAATEAIFSDIHAATVASSPVEQMRAIVALTHRVAGLAALEKPEYNEASLFGELKSIAKAICDFAYENKKHTGLFFDVVAKDGCVFRVDLSMIRLDAFPRKPLVVLEPKPKLGSYPCPECGYINNRPGTCSNAVEHLK